MTAKKYAIIIAATAALITALMPGIIAWMEGAGAKADNASQKADLGYELLKQRVEFQTSEMNQMQTDLDRVRSDISEIHKMLLEMKVAAVGGIRTTGGGRLPTPAAIPEPPKPDSIAAVITPDRKPKDLPASLEKAMDLRTAIKAE